jgi:outer membrane receptor for ferrienterochelin and colicin
MQIRYYLAASAAALSIATVLATPAMAQETTSAVRGTVEGEGGPVSGATVTIVHEPSGTTATSTTDSDGNFSANGLRIGGPFTVTVEAAGFESAQITDLSLTGGQSTRLPVVLQAQQEIVVTASALQGAIETSTGPITALNREDIEGVASINRDIRDLARRDPFATIDLTNSRTIEVAGQNGRLNRFSVDGVQFSDDFGLNNGGLPTSRGPVPLDAIEQFSVKVAPYDVSEGDFQGGAINVLLRSGGNKFRGSAFGSYTDQSLTGKRTRGRDVALEFDSKQYGGVISGPIVKDTLFFMFAYEKTEESDPFDSGPQGQGFAAPITGVTQALVDQISNIAQTRYGYDTLGVIRNGVEEDEKFVAKLDWNVNDDHRASLTYIRNIGTQANQRNTSTSTTSPTLGLFSTGYELSEEVNSGVFQLNSNWSETFSTELRASYRDYNRGQIPYGEKTLGEIAVCADPTQTGSVTSCSNGVPRIFFGPDQSRHANALNTDNLSVDFTARLDAGDHQFKALFGYTQTNVFNLFVQNALGTYYFDSVADFQAGNAGRLIYQNAVPSLDPNDGAAQFGSSSFTFGLQDDWQVTDKLQFTIGARFDLFGNEEKPPLNPNFVQRHGFSNRATFDGKGVFQPRIGFSYDATDRLIIRGGVGVFAGGTPDVFLSNSFSNTGQLTNSVTLDRTATGCEVARNVPAPVAVCNAALNNVPLTSIPAVVGQFLATNTALLANAPVNAIDPDLKIARQLRATLSADYEADLGPLGDGWLFGANFLYGNVLQGYQWTDIRSVAIGTLPDGRARFGNLPGTSGPNQDLLMTNSTRGRSYVAVARIAKEWDFGLGIEGSYTRADVKDENAITSTTAGSLYNNNVFNTPNAATYGRSIYEIKDQWKFGINFQREFFGDNETRLSLFGEYRSGRPYSLTTFDTTGTSSSARSVVFGTTGTGSRHLIYVPTVGDTRVSFGDNVVNGVVVQTGAQAQAAFETLVTNLGLEKFRGKILPKNSQTSPDFFKVDLSISQELPLFVGNAKLKLFADVENVLNFIDSDWGALRQVAFPYAATIANVQCLSVATPNGPTPTANVNTAPTQPCAQYRYSNVVSPNVDLVSRQSLYGIRVGVKVSF